MVTETEVAATINEILVDYNYSPIIISKKQFKLLSDRDRLHPTFLAGVEYHLLENYGISTVPEDNGNSRFLFSKTTKIFHNMTQGSLCTHSRTFRNDMLKDYIN